MLGRRRRRRSSLWTLVVVRVMVREVGGFFFLVWRIASLPDSVLLSKSRLLMFAPDAPVLSESVIPQHEMSRY